MAEAIDPAAGSIRLIIHGGRTNKSYNRCLFACDARFMHFCTFSLANTPQIKFLLKQVQLHSSILIFLDMYCIYLVIIQGFSP